MDRQRWLEKNQAAISTRLQWLAEKADGVLYFEPVGAHFIAVLKSGAMLRLVQMEQANPSVQLTQSRLDLSQPLFLNALYTQALVLSLLWQPQPERACIIGLGGGRLPMILHHYFPRLIIECAEIEPAMLEVAAAYFGLPLDERLSVAIEDGRTYLTQRGLESRFNLMLVDVFLGSGYSPYKLATLEFFQLCRLHLAEGGVLAVNLFSDDPFLARKLKTIQAAFEQVYVCAVGGNTLVFGATGSLLSDQALLARARMLQETHQFLFPFVARAHKLKKLPHPGPAYPAQLLLDAFPPDHYFDSLPSFKPVFSQIAPDVPCPCGSGQRFGQCHGQAGQQ